MKISITNTPFKISEHNLVFLNNKHHYANTLERVPSADVVSFSGYKNSDKISPNIQSALEYSQEILALNAKDITLENISEITTKYAKGASVHRLSDLGDKVKDSENFGAFFLAKVDENLEASTNELYFDLPNDEIDDMQKLLFASDCAHEFTHLKQMQTLEMSKLLKTMAKGDVNYGKAIMSIGNAIFDLFHTQIQGQILAPVIKKYMNYAMFFKYKEITPTKAPLDKKEIISAFGADGEHQAHTILKNTFEKIFESAYAQALREPKIMALIPRGESKEALMRKVMAYCSKKALEEKEAYLAESELSRKALGIKTTLNIDAFPMYYDVLAKAFS